MTQPPSPQSRDTEQGWAWNWTIPEGLPDPETGHQVEHEFELEWLSNARRWQVRSAYDKGGWGPALYPSPPIADPESFERADYLAREYADRPRGR